MFGVFKRFAGLKKENYIFFIGRLVTSLGNFVWPMLTFFMTTKLGYSDATAALILSIVTFLGIPTSFIGGRLADKMNRKWIIIIFDTIGITLFIIASIIPFSFMTIALIFLGSMSQSIEYPAYEALQSDFSSTEDRERACTLNYLGINIGVIAGSAMAGLLFKNYTRLAILLNAVAISISTILILLFVNMNNAIKQEEVMETPESIYEEPVEHNISVFAILKQRYILIIFSLVLFFSWIIANINGTLLPLKLKSLHGEGGATIYGFLSSFNGFIVIAATPIFSLLAKKYHEIPKMLLGTFFYVFGALFFMLTENTTILFVGMFFFTIGEIFLVLGSSSYMSRRIPLSHRGRIMALISIVETLIISLFQFIISRMLDASGSNYLICYISLIVFGTIALIFGVLYYKKDKKMFKAIYEMEIK